MQRQSEVTDIMLPLGTKNKATVSLWRYFLALTMLAYIFPAYAADATNAVTSVSAQQMVANIASQLPNLMRMVTAMAYVMGMYFIILGIFKLKQYGEARTQMSHEHQLKGPLLYIVIGALLLYLPSSVQIGLSTFWSSPAPYGYKVKQDEWAQFYIQIYRIVQLIGVIAFIRGLVLLTHLSGHGGQHGTFGKAMVHIVAGIFCINIYQFISLVFATLGISANT